MGGVPRWAHRPYHIVGVSGGGKWAASGYFLQQFFTAKHFVIEKNLLTLQTKKMLYNIIIQHKTADGMSAGLKNKRKNI